MGGDPQARLAVDQVQAALLGQGWHLHGEERPGRARRWRRPRNLHCCPGLSSVEYLIEDSGSAGSNEAFGTNGIRIDNNKLFTVRLNSNHASSAAKAKQSSS